MICNVCGSDKAPTDFYKNDRTCKLCRCAKVRANRAIKVARDNLSKEVGYEGGLKIELLSRPWEYRIPLIIFAEK